MPDDEKIVRCSLDRQTRGKEYALAGLPTYRAWSKRKLEQGESPAFIAHLDAMTIWLLPEELPNVGAPEFEELLADLKEADSGRE